MLADALAEELLDEGAKRLVRGQRHAREGGVGRLQAASEGGDVEAVWGADFLRGDLVAPEGLGGLRLRDARGGQVRVGPESRAIAIEERPVAVPGGGAVEGLSGVVIAVAVAAHEEEFIGDVGGASALQAVDFVREELPLGEGAVERLAGVGAVDEAEIGGCLGVSVVE